MRIGVELPFTVRSQRGNPGLPTGRPAPRQNLRDPGQGLRKIRYRQSLSFEGSRKGLQRSASTKASSCLLAPGSTHPLEGNARACRSQAGADRIGRVPPHPPRPPHPPPHSLDLPGPAGLRGLRLCFRGSADRQRSSSVGGAARFLATEPDPGVAQLLMRDPRIFIPEANS